MMFLYASAAESFKDGGRLVQHQFQPEKARQQQPRTPCRHGVHFMPTGVRLGGFNSMNLKTAVQYE